MLQVHIMTVEEDKTFLSFISSGHKNSFKKYDKMKQKTERLKKLLERESRSIYRLWQKSAYYFLCRLAAKKQLHLISKSYYNLQMRHHTKKRARKGIIDSHVAGSPDVFKLSISALRGLQIIFASHLGGVPEKVIAFRRSAGLHRAKWMEKAM